MGRIKANALASILLLLLTLTLTGCMVFPQEQEQSKRSLRWCPPLPNCASTEAISFIHSIKPFKLKMELETAWPIVRESVNSLEGTHIEYEDSGYIYAKSYSKVFHFLDYFEVLAVPERQELAVRSSSLFGLTDFFVNYFRTERLREMLVEKGVIQGNYAR